MRPFRLPPPKSVLFGKPIELSPILVSKGYRPRLKSTAPPFASTTKQQLVVA